MFVSILISSIIFFNERFCDYNYIVKFCQTFYQNTSGMHFQDRVSYVRTNTHNRSIPLFYMCKYNSHIICINI